MEGKGWQGEEDKDWWPVEGKGWMQGEGNQDRREVV